jgi:hypothetical protein
MKSWSWQAGEGELFSLLQFWSHYGDSVKEAAMEIKKFFSFLKKKKKNRGVSWCVESVARLKRCCTGSRWGSVARNAYARPPMLEASWNPSMPTYFLTTYMHVYSHVLAADAAYRCHAWSICKLRLGCAAPGDHQDQ